MQRTYQNQTCQYQHQNTQVWTEAHLWTLKRREAGGSSIDMEICSVWFGNSWATRALTQWFSVLDEGRQCMIYSVMFGSQLMGVESDVAATTMDQWMEMANWCSVSKWLICVESCSAWKWLAQKPFYTEQFNMCFVLHIIVQLILYAMWYVSIGLRYGTIILRDQSSHDGGILGRIMLFC